MAEYNGFAVEFSDFFEYQNLDKELGGMMDAYALKAIGWAVLSAAIACLYVGLFRENGYLLVPFLILLVRNFSIGKV